MMIKPDVTNILKQHNDRYKREAGGNNDQEGQYYNTTASSRHGGIDSSLKKAIKSRRYIQSVDM
jgi:hypothetical protein